jgi:outer membrane protein TolC
MRPFARLALGLVPMAGLAQPHPASADIPAVHQPASTGEDPLLRALIREALDRNPDHQKYRTLVEAEKERVPQAKALPDPSLSLGLQNDGFRKLQVGMMETSYYQVMLTQPLP